MVNGTEPLDASEIRACLAEVAEELGVEGPRYSIVIVGGALLAWHELRGSTYDIDTITRLDDEIKVAIHSVGARRGLRLDWLNDHARAFIPATFTVGDCTVLLDSLRLRVLAPPLRQVFLMKLYRSSAQDFEDMVSIWNQCGFRSAQEVVEDFVTAYPHAPDDEFLVEFVTRIANESTGD